MIRLAKYFPTRYQAFIIDHTVGILAGLAALVVMSCWFAFYRVTPHTHDGYHRYPVLHTFDVSDETLGYRLRVVFEVEDGAPKTVTLKSFPAAMQVVDTICVERRLRSDGAYRYQRTSFENCT